MGARAVLAGLLISLTANKVLLADGAGLISQRNPYVRVSLEFNFHVSCAKKLVL